MELEPRSLQQQLLKRRGSIHSSDDEQDFFLMSSDTSDSSDQFEDLDEGTSDEEDLESLADESLYRKKYIYLKKIAKSIIFVSASVSRRALYL